MRVSVVIPVYAGASPEHFRAALRSVVSQTRPADEVVVVADGPLLPAHEADLTSRALEHPELHVVRLSKQRGAAAAIQAGVDAANGDWIARADADDICLPNRFEVQCAALVASGADVCGSAMFEFYGGQSNIVGIRRLPRDHAGIARRMRINSPLNHPTVLFRRALALDVGGYRHLAYLEDYDLWARMLAGGARFMNLDQPLVLFRADDSMYQRRASAEVLCAERELQINLHHYGLISGPRMCVNYVVRSAFRRLPQPLLRRAYDVFFRTASDHSGPAGL